VITLPHTVRIFQSLPKAQLCVFPGATHMILQQDPQRFNETRYRFFFRPFIMPDSR
jgi:pimeloyl-ACP methyl ester carboxylesterase